jgi:hypothetical protein
VLAVAIGVLTVDQLGLLRVEHQSTFGEAALEPFPEDARLMFGAAVADDVVGVPFEWNTGHRPPQPDVERIVQEQVGQQGRDHPALRRSLHPGDKLAVVEHRRRLQPTLDVEQRPGAVGVLAHGLEQQLVIDTVEEALDVDIDHPISTPTSLARRPDRIERPGR